MAKIDSCETKKNWTWSVNSSYWQLKKTLMLIFFIQAEEEEKRKQENKEHWEWEEGEEISSSKF